MTLIAEKKELFNGLCIPWNPAIKDEFKRERKLHPDADQQIMLDRICKPYLSYAFEHEAETYHAWLKEKHGDKAILRSTLKREIGEENFYLLFREGLIEKIPYKENHYILKGK